MNEICENIQRQIVTELADMGVVSDEKLLENIDKIICREGKKENLSLKQRIQYRKDIFNAIRGLDLIQGLLDDASVTEIMVNGYQDIFIEQNGKIKRYEKSFSSEEKLNDIIQKMVSSANRVVNETTPVVDARLEDGSRINVVLPPISLVGPVITIRKFPEQFSASQLVEKKSISQECADFLKKLVEARYNIFISGANRIIGLSQMTFRKQRVQTT